MQMADEEKGELEQLGDLQEEASKDEVALAPSEAGDPPWIIASKIPADIRERYDVFSYRNAAVILSETRSEEFNELLQVLRKFQITTKMIRRAGGNESEIPKLFSSALRPLGWHETIIQGDLAITLTWKEQVGIVAKGRQHLRHKEGTWVGTLISMFATTLAH